MWTSEVAVVERTAEIEKEMTSTDTGIAEIVVAALAPLRTDATEIAPTATDPLTTLADRETAAREKGTTEDAVVKTSLAPADITADGTMKTERGIETGDIGRHEMARRTGSADIDTIIAAADITTKTIKLWM